MELKGNSWWSKIPNEPGWYIIKTNTPIEIFESLPTPKGKQYKINEKVTKIKVIANTLNPILPSKFHQSYVVYNGHSANLKSRAREHTSGDQGTGCLALSQYMQLWDYQWAFGYVTLKQFNQQINDNKLLRIAVEQAWRYQYGWPILCSN